MTRINTDLKTTAPVAAGSLTPLPRTSFYDRRAAQRPRELRRYYHRLLKTYYRVLVPPGARVLELGCGLGDLLAAVEPRPGVGVDASPVMIKLARQRHPELSFLVVEAESFIQDEPFDYILLSDLVNELYDVQALLVHLHQLSHARTRLVINFFNHLWRPLLKGAELLGLKASTPPQNWLSTHDMANLLHLAGWEVVKTEARILWPVRTPIWGTFWNRWVAPFLRHLCLTTLQIARPGRMTNDGMTNDETLPIADCRLPIEETTLSNAPVKSQIANRKSQIPSCSVIVPARNEAGNIEELLARIPELGLGTEIIFVEGGSTDNTWEEIQRVARRYPQRKIKVLKQMTNDRMTNDETLQIGEERRVEQQSPFAICNFQSPIFNSQSPRLGKAAAVRQGLAAATGDLLFILDADLTVLPEELTKFYAAACSGRGEFINGVRSVYPLPAGAMRFCNMVGNKFFSLLFGFLLGQPLKDTLCGTKVFFRADYEAIAKNRAYFGAFDPFGDFDLLFGAARLNLRIIDLPVHYQARTYGQTNILRWRHGWLLLRMAWLAARRLKFI